MTRADTIAEKTIQVKTCRDADKKDAIESPQAETVASVTINRRLGRNKETLTGITDSTTQKDTDF